MKLFERSLRNRAKSQEINNTNFVGYLQLLVSGKFRRQAIVIIMFFTTLFLFCNNIINRSIYINCKIHCYSSDIFQMDSPNE